jgi:hypothetical protein
MTGNRMTMTEYRMMTMGNRMVTMGNRMTVETTHALSLPSSRHPVIPLSRRPVIPLSRCHRYAVATVDSINPVATINPANPVNHIIDYDNATYLVGHNHKCVQFNVVEMDC